MLEPVRESYRTGQSLEWTRVNYLPDFVYFNHSIHITKGVGCYSCHGAGGQDAADVRGQLDAHGVVPELPSRAGEVPAAARPGFQHEVRAAQLATNPVKLADGSAYTDQMAWAMAEAQYHVRTVEDITSCSTCHR